MDKMDNPLTNTHELKACHTKKIKKLLEFSQSFVLIK